MESTNEIENKFAQMLEDPVERLVCRLAVPSIINMLISSFYDMANTYFVSSLGTSAIAAVGIAFPIMAIIQAVGLFWGQGCGNYISRQLGSQNSNAASKMASTGFFSTLISSGVVAILGLIFLNPLLSIMGATETIQPLAYEYLFYILIAAPFMAATFMLNNLLRFQGNAFYGMLGITTGAVLNIALNPLFIFVFDMGVKGASIATMISQIVSFSILFYINNYKSSIKISFKKFTASYDAYREIFRGGMPSLCMQGMAAISTIFLNVIASGFGDAAIAAMSIVQRIIMFATSLLVGFGQGFQPVCGFNYGAKRYDRVKKAFWFCFKVSAVVLCVFAVLGYIFAPEILSVFRNDDPESMQIAIVSLQLRCLVFPLLAWVVLVGMLLQTIGKTAPASVLALARQGLFLLPLLFVFTPYMGIFGLQISQPAADVITFFVSLHLGFKALREMTVKE